MSKALLFIVITLLLQIQAMAYTPSFFRNTRTQYPCRNNPCRNGGVCQLTGGTDPLLGYQCVCQPGFRGLNCEAKEVCDTVHTPAIGFPASSSVLGFAHGTIEIIAFAANLFTSGPEITIALRGTALTTYSTFNAAAPYFMNDTSDIFGNMRSRPMAERTHDNMNIASFFAGVRILEYIFRNVPSVVAFIHEQATIRGMDLSVTEACMSTPWGMGNLAASEVIEYGERDGFNSRGDVNKFSNPLPFEDYTPYHPFNTPEGYPLKDLRRWQPLIEKANNYGYNIIQSHITAQAGSARTFALTPEDLDTDHAVLPPYSFSRVTRCTDLTSGPCKTFKDLADETIEAMRTLNDTNKMIAEHYDNKINSLGLPILQFFQQVNMGHEDLTVWGLSFDIVLQDAMIAVWRQKIIHDAIRPASIIKEIYRGKTINGYAKGRGVNVPLRGDDFQSYLRTMPHSEFPSGTACFCQAITEFNKMFYGKDLTQTFTFPAGSSSFEPGMTPAQDVTLTFTTFDEVNDVCGQSRVNAGVHFLPSITAGRQVCSGIAAKVINKLSAMLNRPIMPTGN